MTVKLLTEHHFEFLSLKGGCTGASESTLVVGNHMSRLIFALVLTKLTVENPSPASKKESSEKVVC